MAIKKEFREFFLRHVAVTSGTKPDQEIPFATTYYIGSTLVYNRFLKGDYPSKDVFTKLFESLTFKLNKEDTAQLTQQGLVKIATDANSRDRISNATGDYTAGVVPHQLPEVILLRIGGQDVVIDSSTGTGITMTRVARTIAGKMRMVYQIQANVENSVEISGDAAIALVNDQATPGNYFYYGTDSSGVKGYFNLAGLINSMIDDELDAEVFPVMIKKFTKQISSVGDGAVVTIPYSEITGAIGVFTAGGLGSGTTSKPKTDYHCEIWRLVSSTWTLIDNNLSGSNIVTSINDSTGDLSITFNIAPSDPAVTYRVVLIG